MIDNVEVNDGGGDYNEIVKRSTLSKSLNKVTSYLTPNPKTTFIQLKKTSMRKIIYPNSITLGCSDSQLR